MEPELIFVADRCARCGRCAAACERGVHEVSADGHAIERGRCIACGRCAAACPAGALEIKGRRVSAGEVVGRAERMRPFFRHSGGGVTLTGGEATVQPEFAAAVLEGCRERGIHTALETCGACGWEELERLLRHTDLVLYDLKLMDDDEHRRWTGASNRQILENAARLEGREVRVRVPLIPGVTDTQDNLGAIFQFMRQAGLRRAELLPFNPSSKAKYEWLGLPFELEGERQDGERLGAFLNMAEEAGVEAAIG